MTRIVFSRLVGGGALALQKPPKWKAVERGASAKLVRPRHPARGVHEEAFAYLISLGHTESMIGAEVRRFGSMTTCRIFCRFQV